MLGDNWRRIRNWYFCALDLGVLFTTFTFFGYDYLPRALAPCPNATWQNVVAFFMTLCFGVAVVEGLNWVGLLIARKLARPADFELPKSEPEPSRYDLLIPGGWTGLALSVVLLTTPYVMHDPSQCEPFRLGAISFRFVLGALMIAYGLLLVGQLFREINSKVSLQKHP
jgi:hypothetical protein